MIRRADLDGITPEHLRAYLIATGWEKQKPVSEFEEPWRTGQWWVDVPTWTEARDYCERVATVIRTAAQRESRYETDVLLSVRTALPGRYAVIVTYDDENGDPEVTILRCDGNELTVRVEPWTPELDYLTEPGAHVVMTS